MNHIYTTVLLFISALTCFGQINKHRNLASTSVNSSEWVQTNGPGGGFVSDMVFDPYNSNTLYAIGSSEGIYRTINSGDSWEYLKFKENGHADDLETSKSGNGILFSNHLMLSKSTDGGENWKECNNGIAHQIQHHVFKVDPLNPDILYVAGHKMNGNGVGIFKSTDLGESWEEITNGLDTPPGSEVSAMALCGDGKVYIGVNDEPLTTWHRGKVFYSPNDGIDWNELDYGAIEDRFIYSIHVNTMDSDEIWISQRSLYNTSVDQPSMYYSTDGGEAWNPVISDLHWYDQPDILGNSIDGQTLYFACGGGLFYLKNYGKSIVDIGLPEEIMRFDLHSLAIHPYNQNELFLPTGSGGIAHTDDNGSNWIQKNEGIANTSINLLAVDPINPGRLYCASWIGEGIFRSDDYGQHWKFLNNGGIVHPWDDELVVDPTDPSRVWYVADVPYIHISKDYGDNWRVINNPYNGGSFNFGSVYSIGQSNNDKCIYAINQGFGIFKGSRTREDESYHWDFLNLSGIDYSYSLSVEPDNDNIIYSGYSRKPFETKAKIRASYDGGKEWFTSLEVDGAEAVTSVEINPLDVQKIYAASVGENGARLWGSDDKGQHWKALNDHFNFTTIHAFANITNTPVAYAGVWGGGTFKTSDEGKNWKKLESSEVFSAAMISVLPNDTSVVYAADRTRPVLYKSENGGTSWTEYFNAGNEYRRLMSVTIDPSDPDNVYVAAMTIGGPGKLGGLFQVNNNSLKDISGILPRVALTLTIDQKDPSTLYSILHETGIYKSIDSGENWTDISGEGSGLPSIGFNNLIIDPTDSDRLFLIGGCDVRFETFESAGLDPDLVNSVFLSEDGGNTWRNINNGILGKESGNIKSLVFHQDNPKLIYLGTESGVYYSTSSEYHWKKDAGLPYKTLGGIAISGNTLYAYTNGAGLFRGIIDDDHSITWDSEQKIVSKIHFAQMIKDHSNSSTLYASAYPGGIFKSTDNGNTWHEKNFGMVSFEVEDPLRQGYYSLEQSPTKSDVLYLGLFKRGVYKSSNGGETWYPVNGPGFEMSRKGITSIAIDRHDDKKVYVGTDDGVYITDDGGISWNPLNKGLSSLDVRTLHLNQQNQLFAGTRGYGLYQLINGSWLHHSGFGQWGTIWPMWDNRPMYQYTSLLIHPEDNSRMLIGTFPQGIYKSTDGGGSWKESNVGWTNDGVFYLTCHPENPEIIFAGTYNGINRSTDFGNTWEWWDHGIPPEQWVFSIDFDPRNPDIMYACSKNGENMGRGRENFKGTVVKSIDGGKNWIEITNGLGDGINGIEQEFYKIIVDRFDPNTLYLAAQNEGIFISRNGGEDWKPWNDGLTTFTPGSNGNNVTNTLVLSSDNSILYFGTSGAGVWRRMIAPILPVHDLSAILNEHQVTLSWSFEDMNQSFNAYKIYREEQFIDSIAHLSPIATFNNASDTSYLDAAVVPGKQYFYVVTAEDDNEYVNPYFYTLGPVVDVPLTILFTSLDSGRVNVPYRDTIHIEGGISPYSFEIIDGNLPDGLILDNKGIIKGIPAQEGSFRFLLVAVDIQNQPFRDTSEFIIHIAENLTTHLQPFDDFSKSILIYPNPTIDEVCIDYTLTQSSNIEIEIINARGEKIQTIQRFNIPPGTHSILWDGKDSSGTHVQNGTYLVIFHIGSDLTTKKLIVSRN